MNTLSLSNEILSQSLRRRTFAIISHPDAGKTTLTEKLLLYSGMIRTAGMVTARKGKNFTSSDWMALEQERGISITASAMQFIYQDRVINVLDTPGHQDFSEDTYRTLTAADSAIMVLDAAKGVEAQTRKLFAVCRLRNTPVLTFINKLDLPARDPLELMEEVEEVLGIQAAPICWPIGYGRDFCGIVDISAATCHIFSREVGKSGRTAPKIVPLQGLSSSDGVEEVTIKQLHEELELLRGAGNVYSHEKFLKGLVTPVFFGSAITNIGVEFLFDEFVNIAPPPAKRAVLDAKGEEFYIEPSSELFAGFVFKIQANMNPKHRDSMAFIRICSGRFERDLVVMHQRLEKQIRLSRSHSMFGGERETVEKGYPGDIVGVVNPGIFSIGDTISSEGNFKFPPMPQFSPEVTARVRPKNMTKLKAFSKGMSQLSSEGAFQMLQPLGAGEPLVAAVGKLQFEVLQHRLKSEYSVETNLDLLPYIQGSWLEGDANTFKKPLNALLAHDYLKRVVVLFSSSWEKEYAERENPNHRLLEFVR
jgi:peptide chain release factor 3